MEEGGVFAWKMGYAGSVCGANPNYLHVGCIFSSTIDKCTLATYQCIDTEEEGCEGVKQVDIRATHIAHPRLCLFSDHTRGGDQHVEAIINFLRPCVINDRRWRGAWFSFVPSSGDPFRRDLMMLTELPPRRNVPFYFSRHDTRVVAQTLILDQLAQQCLDTMDKEFEPFPGDVLHVRWLAAYHQMRALQLVSRRYAFDRRAQQTMRRMQLTIQQQFRHPVGGLVKLHRAPTYAPGVPSIIPFLSVATLEDVVGQVISSVKAAPALPARRSVQVAVPNYVRCQKYPDRMVLVSIRYYPGNLGHIVGQLMKLAKLFEACGHGYDGQQFSLARAVARVRNQRNTNPSARLNKLYKHLTEWRPKSPLLFYDYPPKRTKT